MKLSANFSLIELTSSETASRKNIKNEPAQSVIDNLSTLALKVLQPLREAYGKPINITSGFRSVALNKAIGGSANSQHCLGQAADFTVPKEDYLRVFNILKKMEFDQLIWEFGDSVAPQWIHVSFAVHKNRRQVLRAKKGFMGRTVYEPY
jgi:hypothetical protein